MISTPDHKKLVGLSDEELLNLAPEATHQHFKGGLYKYLGVPRDAATGELLQIGGLLHVSYLHLYPHEVGVWIRSLREWNDEVRPGQPRFRKLFRG